MGIQKEIGYEDLGDATYLDYDSDKFKENGIKVFFTILKWYFLL